MVDPDQDLDAPVEVLPKHRFQRVRDRLAHHRRHDDRYVARTLRIETVIRKSCQTRRESSGHSHHHCVWCTVIGTARFPRKCDSGAAARQPASGVTRALLTALSDAFYPHPLGSEEGTCSVAEFRANHTLPAKRSRTMRELLALGYGFLIRTGFRIYFYDSSIPGLVWCCSAPSPRCCGRCTEGRAYARAGDTWH
jgi:hypothetical protein